MPIKPQMLAFARSKRTTACYLTARIQFGLPAESEVGTHRRSSALFSMAVQMFHQEICGEGRRFSG